MGVLIEFIIRKIIREIFRGTLAVALLSGVAWAEEPIRTAQSCATVAEVNALRADTVSVAKAHQEIVEAQQKQLDAQDQAIRGLFEVLKTRGAQ